jgi:asparagine synthase (glutamine-hydrolysing)
MCGIVGALTFDKTSFRISEPYLARMLRQLAHRGPDGSAVWISSDKRVGLGHHRLSIIDLSPSAAQPMCNEDGTLWVSFNGEIYNHAEIRRELESLGSHRWKTDHSDTEVILHAFEQWGIECLQRFRGMFAIALWDARNRELWLVRDRLGVKPLYYSIHHNRIVFASEIKALLQDADQPRQVDEEAFYHFLSFLTAPAPLTLFAGIRKLPPATWMRICADGTTEESRYWDVWDHASSLAGISEEAIAEQLLQELRTAVRLRKISDVPVGVFLSGGIDSSFNTVLFSEGERAPVKCFSIGYDSDYRSYSDELPYARRMAAAANVEYHERLLNEQDLLDFLPRMIHSQDEPIADPVCVPVYYVSKLARDHGVTVCQVGEGSDELFCGYRSWKVLLQLQRWGDLPLPQAVKHLALSGLRLVRQNSNREYEWLRRNVEQLPLFWSGAEGFTEAQKRALLSPRLRRKFSGLSSWEILAPIYHRFRQKARGSSPLQWMTYADLNLRLPELLLMRVDKMSMAVGLEARVPFLDHKFVEFAMSIPPALKTKNGTLKYILKKSVAGLIPDEILHRKKQGFGVPIQEWFVNRLGSFARAELLHFCDQTDFLNRPAVMKLFESRDPRPAWYLLNFALWWKEYVGCTSSAMASSAD